MQPVFIQLLSHACFLAPKLCLRILASSMHKHAHAPNRNTPTMHSLQLRAMLPCYTFARKIRKLLQHSLCDKLLQFHRRDVAVQVCDELQEDASRLHALQLQVCDGKV